MMEVETSVTQSDDPRINAFPGIVPAYSHFLSTANQESNISHTVSHYSISRLKPSDVYFM